MQSIYEENGYPSKTVFLKLAKEAGFARTEAMAFITGKTEHQVFNRVKIPVGKFDHGSYHYALMADLMDMSRYSRSNGNHRYILNILDFHSKYVWSYPLKTKTPKEIAPLIEKTLLSLRGIDEAPMEILFIRFIVDDGGEFKKEVLTMLKKYPLVMRLVAIPKKRRSTAPVERFNGTLLKNLSRAFLATGSDNWVGKLEKVITAYNKRGGANSPTNKLGKYIPALDLDNVPVRRFKPGDTVRKVEETEIFDKKGIKPKLSLEIYTVVKYDGSFVIIKNKAKNIEEKVIENEIMPVVAAGEAEVERVEGVKKATKVRDTKNKTVRLARREVAVGHEAYVNDDGDVALKSRLLPKDTVRVRKAPRKAV